MFRAVRLFVLVTIAVSITTGGATAGDIMLYSWDQEISGSAHGRDSGTGATASGTLRSDDNRETGFRLYTKFLGRRFEIGYFSLKNDTIIDATGTFSFNGTDYNTAFPINYSMDAKVYEFFPNFNIVNRKGSSLDFIFGFKVFDMNTKISGTDRSTGTTVQEELDETVPVPQIGIRFRLGELKKGLRFEGSYKTLDLEVSGVDVKLDDLQFFAAYRTGQDFDIILGYRKISNKFTDDKGGPNEAGVDIDNDGVFFGGRLNF